MNGFRITCNSRPATALDQMSTMLRNALERGLAIRQWRRCTPSSEPDADAALNWSRCAFHGVAFHKDRSSERDQCTGSLSDYVANERKKSGLRW